MALSKYLNGSSFISFRLESSQFSLHTDYVVLSEPLNEMTSPLQNPTFVIQKALPLVKQQNIL